MTEQIIKKIAAGENVRQNLSGLREDLREAPHKMQLAAAPECLLLWERCLDHKDAKVRKNTASLYRDLAPALSGEQRVHATGILLDAYRQEKTLFVRSFYLKALGEMGTQLPVDELSRQLEMLADAEDPQNQKHIREERRLLEQLLQKRENDCHRFTGCKNPRTVLLLCDSFCRELLAGSIKREHTLTPWGVRLMHRPGDGLEDHRLYEKMLFAIRLRKGTSLTREHMGEVIAASELLRFCGEVFTGKGSYTFRLRLCDRAGKSGDSRWLKAVSFELEESTGGKLRNELHDPQIELYLFPKSDGSYALYAGIPQVGSARFSYRRHVEPTSMAPYAAAKMIAMCRPYLRKQARVLDPLCGVGTLLIERDMVCPAQQNVGVDLYGKAIEGAGENTKSAGVDAHYINRNYFDFTYRHPFDEVITEAPRFSRDREEEAEDFYRSFFKKTMEVTAQEAWIFLLSSEEGKVKKYIRLSEGLSLERQMEFRKKEWLYIIRKRG